MGGGQRKEKFGGIQKSYLEKVVSGTRLIHDHSNNNNCSGRYTN